MNAMMTYERLELAGAALTLRLCAKEQSMKQSTLRCAKGCRAPQIKRCSLGRSRNADVR
jgi:hypothetical protein